MSRDRTLAVRFSYEEYGQLQEAAKVGKYRSISDFIRTVSLASTDEELWRLERELDAIQARIDRWKAQRSSKA